MRVGSFFFPGIIIASVLFCSGCSSDTEKPKESQPAMRVMGEATTPPAASSDETPATNESIGFEIRRLFNADPATTAGIIVEVDDGKVTLRGAAPTMAASWRAEGIAHAVKGVKSVVNQIAVKSPNVLP